MWTVLSEVRGLVAGAMKAFQVGSLLVARCDPGEITDGDYTADLGCFDVVFSADEPSKVWVAAVTPNEFSSHPHPHVDTGGNPCMNAAAESLRECLGEGAIAAAFDLVSGMLGMVNQGAEYERLSVFLGESEEDTAECSECGIRLPEEEMWFMDGGGALCGSCRAECYRCGWVAPIESGEVEQCVVCEEGVCTECSVRCDGCEEIMCGRCAIACPTCGEGQYCGRAECGGLAPCKICGEMECERCRDRCTENVVDDAVEQEPKPLETGE